MQLVQRTVAGDQRVYELLVIKYQRRIERLIARMVRDDDPGAGHCPRNFFARLPGPAAVSRRGAVLHLAVPHCGEYGEKNS